MKSITRTLVMPLLTAGVIGGTALGLAGPAAAATSTTPTSGGHALVATPDKASGKAHNAQQMHTWTQRHHSHNNNWRH